MKKGSHKRDGFTLIEGILSVFILTSLVIYLTGLFPAGYKSIRRSQHYLVATYLCKELLEGIGNMPFDEIPDGTTCGGILIFDGTLTPPTSQCGSIPFPPNPYPLFNNSVVTANNIPERHDYRFRIIVSPGISSKKIVATVIWREGLREGGGTREETISMATLVTP